MGTSEHYCLRWNNHQNNLLGVFSQLLRDESLVDVTLACSEGHSIRAHRVVLSACSSYFQTLFVDHPSRHPIVILKDVRFSELRTLIEFMYRGEVNVEYCQLSALLKTAESLKVKGLAEMTNLSTGGTTTPQIVPSSSSSASVSATVTSQQSDSPTLPPPAPIRLSSSDHDSRVLLEQREHLQRDNRERELHISERESSRLERPDHVLKSDRSEHIIKSEPSESQISSHHQRLSASSTSTSVDDGGITGSTPTPPPRRQCSSASPPPHSSSTSTSSTRRNAAATTSILMLQQQELQDDGGGGDSTSPRPPDEQENVVNLTCSTSSAGPSDLSISQTNSSSGTVLPSCSSRIPPASPHHHDTEPIAGPSGLPPVQQVPLSLKKEVDWGGGMGDEKSATDTEYSRHPYDHQEMLSIEGTRDTYPCMYCGATFPHQSKLTRHILSHSLETLKYREPILHQLQGLPPGLGGVPPEAALVAASAFSRTPHDQPPSLSMDPGASTAGEHTAMDLDLEAAAASASAGSGVLCKFCGKSFPDVGSLIAHLPAHTGDRPFKCEFCGKAFKLRHHMKDHCRVHTGERPFRCALCGKTFSRSTILKAHEKTHYPKYVRKFLSPSPLDTEEESNPHQ